MLKTMFTVKSELYRGGQDEAFGCKAFISVIKSALRSKKEKKITLSVTSSTDAS